MLQALETALFGTVLVTALRLAGSQGVTPTALETVRSPTNLQATLGIVVLAAILVLCLPFAFPVAIAQVSASVGPLAPGAASAPPVRSSTPPPAPAPFASLTGADRHFLLSGESAFLLTGEFPYYRIDSDDWPARLDQVKAAGVRVVTFYIPWNWHMPTPTVVDFDGRTHPSRNLQYFLQLLQERRLSAIAKPGPFICAEVQHGGIPDWFTDAHPEALTLNSRTQRVGFRQDGKPLPAYLAPAYVAAVSDWYRQVGQLLQKWQAPAGPLIAVQVENEIPYSTSELADPFSWGYSSSEIEQYRSWLQQQYPGPGVTGLLAYNRAHQTTYASWADVYPPGMRPLPLADEGVDPTAAPPTPTRLSRWLPYRDWVRWRAWYAAETLRVYSRQLRTAGLQVPLYHNALMLEDEAPTNYQQMGQVAWLGVNYWLGQDPRADEDSFVQGLYRIQLLRALTPDSPLYAPELNWGWGSANSFDFLSRYLLAYLNGFNVYTIVNGSLNPLVGGQPYSNNPVPYPGSAPIGATGVTGAAYASLQELADFLNAHGADLVQTEAPATVAIGHYGIYNEERSYVRWAGLPATGVADLIGRDTQRLPPGQPVTADAWAADQALMKALLRQKVAFHLVNLDVASAADLAEQLRSYRTIFFWSWDYLGHAAQLALAQYVQAGGQLILVGEIPTFDEQLSPDTTLAQAIAGVHSGQVTVVSPSEVSQSTFWAKWATSHPWASPIKIRSLQESAPLPTRLWAIRRIGPGGCFVIASNPTSAFAQVQITFPDEQGRMWKWSTMLGPGQVRLLQVKGGHFAAASPDLSAGESIESIDGRRSGP